MTLEAKEMPMSDTCQNPFFVRDWISPILSERFVVIREVFSLLIIMLAIIFVSNSLRIMLPACSGRLLRKGKSFCACTSTAAIPLLSVCLALSPRSTKRGMIARIKRAINIRSDQNARQIAIESGTFHLWICHFPK